MSSVGVSLDLHYCGGKIKAISFFHLDESDCCGKEMKKPNCCKEKTIAYKVKADQDPGSKALCTKVLSTDALQLPFSASLLLKKVSVTCESWSSDDPPDRSSNPRFLVNRVFRI